MEEVPVPFVLLFSVTLLPKELFLFGRQPEKEIEQSLNQPNDESLEEIVKEVETEPEQEEIYLFQAKKEKIQQFQEEMRQKEEEEAEKLHQQKEKPLRYFPFLVLSPPSLSKVGFHCCWPQTRAVVASTWEVVLLSGLGARSKIRALREEEEEGHSLPGTDSPVCEGVQTLGWTVPHWQAQERALPP